MRSSGAALALAALWAAPALADGVPVFDETLGYEVLGVSDHTLTLSSAGTLFQCVIDEGPDGSYAIFHRCRPILGPKAAETVARAAAGAAESEEAFVAAVRDLPPEALFGAVERTLRSFDCTLSKDDDKTAIQTELARQAAVDAAYDGPLTQRVLDVVGSRGEDALELMIGTGKIVIDPEDDRRVRLVGCP